jgi:SAM-dependent methyltransferase
MVRVYQNPCIRSILTVILLSLPACQCGASKTETISKGNNSYQNVTGDDIEQDRAHWDQYYAKSETYVFGKEPAKILIDNVDILPIGRVLDIAMGEGRNAVYLAKKGFIVDGVDLSETAIRKARRMARENRVNVNFFNADLNHYSIPAEKYEVILNIDYLQRNLIPQIKRGLKRGGVIVFENMTVDQLSNPGNDGLRRDILLKKGELKEAFNDFKVLFYEEKNDGKDAKARLVAMKP